MTLITFNWDVDGDPTDATSVVLSNEGATFGVRRSDTLATVVAAGAALAHPSTGVYTYEVTDPAPGLTYEYWVRVVYDGETYHVQGYVTGDGDPLGTKTIRFVAVQSGAAIVLDDPPVLSNPTGSFGAIRIDTNAVVAADGQAFTASGSLYSTTFDEPADDLTYRYYVEAVVDGVTYHLPRTTAYMLSAALVLGRYTDSTKIEAQFGVENVHKWLGIDDGDDAVDFALRMYKFIAAAEQAIDDALRGGPVSTPLTAPIPEAIVDIASALAGVRMYESRGVVDMNPETGAPQHRLQYQKKQAMNDLARIRNGSLRLDVEDAVRYPQVVCDGTGDDATGCNCDPPSPWRVPRYCP